VALKPLKVANGGVIAQFQPGDLVDPQFLPMVVPSTPVSFRANSIVGSATEALLSMTPSRNYVDGTAATSFQASPGKTLVFAGMAADVLNTANAACGCVYRLRVNITGAVTTASPQIGLLAVSDATMSKNAIDGNFVPLSFGQFTVSVTGTQSFGITQQGFGSGNGFMLWGFEY